LNNALLPIQVSDEFLKKIFAAIQRNAGTQITVDLPQQKVVLEDGSTESFEINPYKKACLLNGYDDIDYLLSLRDEIKHFELTH
jgi:3-isopropylmalate/(R)-2-methylmalate dehydratase small subunit